MTDTPGMGPSQAPGNVPSGNGSGGGRSGVTPPGFAPPAPPPMGPGYPSYYGPPPTGPAKGGVLARIVTGVVTSLLLGSLALNIWLGVYFVSSMQMGMHEIPYSGNDPLNRIVILPITGAINGETAGFVREALKTIRENGKPRALVLRVDSPGGGVGASDRIWHEIYKYKQETKVPIVASYGDVAASGGYYVSCLADYIMAEPTTITGSIGVMFVTFNVEGLMQKIGVDPKVLVADTSREKDLANNLFRRWTEADTQVVQPFLNTTHELFMQRVFEGRKQVVSGLTMEDVKTAASGRAYGMEEARKLKLVDDAGYLEDAIAKAKELAKMKEQSDPQVTIVRNQEGLFSRLGVGYGGSLPAADISPEKARSWLVELGTPQMEYRWQPQR